MNRKACLCTLAVVALWCHAPVIADDLQSVDDIIAAYIKALGGREKVDSVKAMRVTGKMVAQGGAVEFPMSIEIKEPGKIRMEFTVQGMTGVQAYDGTTGWMIMPFAGKPDAEKMPPDQAKMIEDQAELHGPLIDYQKKGHKVELAGKEDLEGAPVYKLKVTKKNGNTEYHFIDAETLLPIKVKTKHEMMGTEFELEVSFGDYKGVDGYLVAYSVEQSGGPMGVTTVVEKVELNPKLADDRFTMPEVKKPETAPEPKEEKKPPQEEKKD